MTESALLLVNKYTPNSETDSVAEITIDKPVNIIGFKNQGYINTNINFVSGSSGSNISNIYINGSITTRSSSINIDNCTVVNGVNVNSPWSNITNSLLYNTIKTNNARQCNFINNTIITTENYTINNHVMSLNSVSTNNTLIKGNLYGEDSALKNRLIWTGNYPLYPVDIQIDSSDKICKDTPENITISVINNNTDTNVLNGYVEVYLDGVFQANSTLTNGVATIIVKSSDVKTMPLKVWYYSNNKYQNTTNYKLVNITKKDVNIEVDEFSAKVNENTTITVHLTENNSNVAVPNGTIKLKFDTQVETVNITEGIATITLKTEEDWILAENMTIIFDETDDYNNNSITIPLNTTLGDVIITNSKVRKDNDNVNFNLYVQNIFGENIIEGTIMIKDNNDNIIVEQTDITGEDVFINITPTEDNLIIVEFTGWVFYNNTTQIINISIPPIDTIVSLDDISSVMYMSTILTATVTDENANNMTTGTVTFTDGEGNIIAEAQVTDGTATTTVTFNEEINSTITATYNPESNEYAKSNATVTLNIQKPVTQLTIDEITLTAGQTVTLTARLTDQLENNITGGKVVFKVNGKTLKDANGKVIYAKVTDGVATAEYTIPDSMADTNITVQATYTGTSKYNKETSEISVQVTKPEATLTIDELPESIQANTNITITARVQAGTTSITTGKVVFKINGKTLKDSNGKVIYAKVGSNGVATLSGYNIGDLKATTYTLKAVFTASGYDRLEANQTISIVA